jgi:undecaprenyl-diphosphatase
MTAPEDEGFTPVEVDLEEAPPAPTSRAAHGPMFERRVHALVTGLALLLVAVVMTALVAPDPRSPPMQALDDRWLGFMVDHRTPWLTRLAKVMSTLGSVIVTLPLRVIVSAVLAWRRRWLQLGAFLGAVVTSELCIGPLKAVVGRPRPPDPMIGSHGTSYPSGHAIAGAVTAFGLVVVLTHPAARRLIWIGCASAFAGLMAISRTYLAVHWLSDVVAGVAIGTGMALTWAAGLELLRDRRRAAGAVLVPPADDGGPP